MKKFFGKFFQSKDSGEKATPNKAGYIIILGLIGILLIFLSNIFSPNEETSDDRPIQQPPKQDDIQPAHADDTQKTSDVDELEKNFEKDLEDMLNKIQGVTEAEVMVNLASTNVNIYEKNIIKGQQTTDENDQNGGTRKVEDLTEETQIVFVRQGDSEVPLLVKKERPGVSGVFVVAKGADHATVKKWIVEAVSRVLDVPTHRVSVMPKSN